MDKILLCKIFTCFCLLYIASVKRVLHACLHVPLNETQNLWRSVGLLCWTFLSFLYYLVTNKVSIKFYSKINLMNNRYIV